MNKKWLKQFRKECTAFKDSISIHTYTCQCGRNIFDIKETWISCWGCGINCKNVYLHFGTRIKSLSGLTFVYTRVGWVGIVLLTKCEWIYCHWCYNSDKLSVTTNVNKTIVLRCEHENCRHNFAIEPAIGQKLYRYIVNVDRVWNGVEFVSVE